MTTPKKPHPSANGFKSDYVLDDIHGHFVDRHTFTIYLHSHQSRTESDPSDDWSPATEPGVEHMMANAFEKNLDYLSSCNSKFPILVNMSTCGGDFDEGMKIAGAILSCPNPVTVLATKWARSMSSIIPLAADRFFLRPPAQFMLHFGTYGFYGLDQEAHTDDIERRKGKEIMLRLYVARLKSQGAYKGWSEERIRGMLLRRIREEIDVFFSADEAVRAGFADGVFTGNWDTLRITKRNMKRRELMFDVLRKPVKVEIKVS